MNLKRLGIIVILIAAAATATYVRTRPSIGDQTDIHKTPAFTARNLGTAKTLKFLVFGDWGTGDEHQRIIAKLMSEKADKDGAQFAIVNGDNFYPAGVTSVTDPQWKQKYLDVYTTPSLQIPFYVCLGNHDYRSEPQAEVEYTGHDQRWKMPARYYTFSLPVSSATSVDFFALDTTPVDNNDKEYIAKEKEWLEARLKVSTAKWKVAFGHHPVYSNGMHGNTKTMISNFLPIFEKYHVDVYLCGHDHDIQVLKPVNGVHFIVSGSGGGWRDVKWRENTIYAQSNLGFVWCAVTDSVLEAQCIDRTGSIKFAYDITKEQ